MEVNIYIETDAKGPARRKKAKGMYLIECVIDNKPYTVHELVEQEQVTENQIALMLLIKALKRMTKSSEIRVFMQCEHILHTIEGHWNIQWEKNGWHNASGKTVKNAELWQELTELLSKHAYTMCHDAHSYSVWMHDQIQRRKD